MTVADLLKKLNVDDNISYYNEGKGRKDVTLAFTWSSDFKQDVQKILSSVQEFPRQNADESIDEQRDITIDDCFNEFKKPEILDEQNKWYCSKCKEHVQATKILEIYRAPPVFVINLKRFKHGGRQRSFSMFGGSSLGERINADVDFPLEGLDLSKHVISAQGKGQNLIYDCFAVSNHMGGLGGGHYTAYAKNPKYNKWFSFNDSSCGEIRNSQNPEK